jgi:hypothetical protein
MLMIPNGSSSMYLTLGKINKLMPMLTVEKLNIPHLLKLTTSFLNTWVSTSEPMSKLKSEIHLSVFPDKPKTVDSMISLKS